MQRSYETLEEEEEKVSYANEIVKPLLKMLDDKRDRHREGAAQLIKEILPKLEYTALDWILPVVVARLANDPPVEHAEPVRLELIQLTAACVETFPHDIAPRGYLDFISAILQQCLSDKDPDMKKECCKCIQKLCEAARERLKPVAINIAKALKPNLQHKQWPVRMESVRAFGQLVAFGAVDIIYDFRDEPNPIKTTVSFVKILMCDRSESVRQAVLDVISDWTMEINERLDMHRHFVPMVLLALTDDIESVRKKAQQIMIGLGKFYEMDNEDNRIDLDSRRVTLKDIKWYADESYPDMTMNVTSTLPVPNLNFRPPLGARHMVAECCRTFIPTLLSDIVALEWNIPNSNLNRRIVAIRILLMTIWFNESNILQYLQAILDALYKVMRDDDDVVKNEAFFCLELLGKFLTPENYIPLIVTSDGEGVGIQDPNKDDEIERREVRRRTHTIFSTTASTTKVNIVIAFRYLLQGAMAISPAHAELLTKAVSSQDMCDMESPDLLLALLELVLVLQRIFLRCGLSRKYELNCEGEAITGSALDFWLFFTVLDIQASENAKVTKRAQEVEADMSTALTGSPTGLYLIHFARALEEQNTMPVTVFSKLLRNGSPVLAKYADSIVNIFVLHLHNVRYDVDVRNHLKFMTLLHDFLLDVKVNKVHLTEDHLEKLLHTVIFPHGKWHVGGAAHLFRKVALSCLSAIIVQDLAQPSFWSPTLTEEQRETEEGKKLVEEKAGLVTNVVDTWRNALDADDPELRVVVVKMFPFIAKLPMTPVEAEDAMKELMLRMDDSNDAIRMHTAIGIGKAFRAFVGKEGTSAGMAKVFSSAEKLSGWVSTLLLHMDDPNVELKEEVCNCLLGICAFDKELVAGLASQVRSKHMTPRLIDKLLTYQP